MTKQNGVDVWPNAAIWMRDELRSKVERYGYNIFQLQSSVSSSNTMSCLAKLWLTFNVWEVGVNECLSLCVNRLHASADDGDV